MARGLARARSLASGVVTCASSSPPGRERHGTAFAEVRLDIDATREQLASALDRQLAEVRSYLATAERDFKTASERLARAAPFQDGSIEVDDWAEQRDMLTGELEGARAKVERFREREAELR